MEDRNITTRHALYALARMIEAEQSYPHGDCASVAPTFNICPSCEKYRYCVAKLDFEKNVSALKKMDRG